MFYRICYRITFRSPICNGGAFGPLKSLCFMERGGDSQKFLGDRVSHPA